jgi:hypothetical protein
LYGGPLVAGYPGAERFFQWQHSWPNLTTYPRLAVETFGWLPVLLGLGAVVAWRFAGSAARAGAIAAAGIIVLNALLFVWYLPYDHWPFLRFFLPATTALAIGSCGLIGDAIGRMPAPGLRRLACALLPAAALASGIRGSDLLMTALADGDVQRRVLTMGRYLREALPANAVIVAYIHGGAAAHYTGRSVLGPSNLAAPALDTLIADLRRLGWRPVLLVDEQLEEPQFRALFAGSMYGALDWPPRAEFVSAARIRYFDLADRERHLAGARWPTDVVR